MPSPQTHNPTLSLPPVKFNFMSLLNLDINYFESHLTLRHWNSMQWLGFNFQTGVIHIQLYILNGLSHWMYHYTPTQPILVYSLIVNPVVLKINWIELNCCHWIYHYTLTQPILEYSPASTEFMIIHRHSPC